jgi:threonylcarbamoyladenosine tRNA methylthiotransferase MtaB
MCKHFHVSLQHPLGKILRLMKRRYSAQQVVDTLCVLDQIPDVFVGMDVITGFPGETQEDFEQSVQVLSSLPWTRLHVFPYSERAGTPATRLSFSVPQEKRLERSRILNALSLERQKKVYQQKLSSFGSRSVLLERFSGKKSDSRLSGLDNAYYRYVFSGDSPLSSRMGEPGHIVQASAYDLVIDSARFEVAFLARIKK